MTRENTNTNEETMTNEVVSDFTAKGMKMYKRIKIGLVKRGFILGVVTAVALQSLATIVVLLIALT